MSDECMDGNIDMVITKSISRFARNTLDCLKYIRQLKDKNIPVIFEKKDFLLFQFVQDFVRTPTWSFLFRR